MRFNTRSFWSRATTQRALTIACALLIALPAGFAQAPGDDTPVPPDEQQQAAPLLSPDQLNNLVAPIALYPDPLLSQVLSASTYPLEIVEAQQWMGQNTNLQGTQLVEAAKQQNWDPSVQALVVFPNALSLLANDIRWTTDLGNAFLAQQADVMAAVQRMRSRARANGKLSTTPQQVVTMANEDGQEAIEIQPADPQVIYVPVYSPTYVWGPPAWGAYPDLWYPSGFGFGFGFGPGYYMSSYYPSWGGWGGWGWSCGWFGGRGLYLNAGFFNRYGYYGGGFGRYYGGGGFGGRAAWRHDPGHRMGIPYPNRNVASRFGGDRGGRFSSYSGRAQASRGQYSGGGGRYDSGRAGSSQSSRFSNGGGSGRSSSSGEWRRFGGNPSQSSGRSDARSNSRSGSGSYRQPSSGDRSNGGFRSNSSSPQSDRSSGAGRSNRGSASTGRYFSSGAPNGGYSPRAYNSPSSPSQSYSAPRSNGGSRSSSGGFSSPRSYSAPSQSYSAPRSYGGSRNSGGGFSAPRSYSAPSQGYSAPRSNGGSRSSGGGGFSAPSSGSRGGGGGSGFSGGGRSGGNSGGGGGRSGGGGGGGGHRR